MMNDWFHMILQVFNDMRFDAGMVLFLDLLRIGSYTVITLVSIWLCFEDFARGPSRKLLWIGAAMEHGIVLVLLALDMRSLVVWMESRWLITPFSVLLALAMLHYAWGKYRDRRRLLRYLDDAYAVGPAPWIEAGQRGQ